MSIGFASVLIGFEKKVFELGFDDESPVRIPGGLLCSAREITGLEISTDPSDTPGARVKARLPEKIMAGELTVWMTTDNIYRESCVEFYESNGTVGEGIRPVKTGIIRERFFNGYAVRQYSSVVKREAWRSRQWKFDSPLQEVDHAYEFRVRWK